MKKNKLIPIITLASLSAAIGALAPFITSCRKKDDENKHSMTFSGTNCTAEGVEEAYAEGANVEFTIKAENHYNLPRNISVEGLEDWDYTVSADKKTATFKCVMGVANVKVTVSATAITHIMTFNGTNCTAEGVEEAYAEGANVEFTIIPDEGCTLPKAIQVTGVVNYEYSIDTQTGNATFTCVMGTENIDVSVNAGLTRNVTFNGTGCTAEGVEAYVEGDDVELTIKPDEHYNLPETIQVTGVDNYEYSIDEQTGDATFTCVMGKNDISVTVVAICISHKMEFKGTKCTAEGIEETYDEGDDVKFTIIPDGGCTLPETIQVIGVVNYEYNIDAQTGNATFTCVMGTKNIVVSVNAGLTRIVTFNGTNCTAEGEEEYDEGDNVELTIKPDEHYTLPETIQVTGVDNYEYNIDAETGIATFTCVMGKNDISVTVVAIAITHIMTFNGTGCTANNEQSYAENQDVKFTITPNEGFTLPSRIDVEGVVNYEYSIDAQTGNATFTCVMGTEDIDVSVFAGLTRNVTFNGTGCTSDARSSYAEGDKVEIIITPDEGYILPNEIEVEGIKGRYDYDVKEDGTALLVFTVGADNITITVVATTITRIVTFNGTNCTAEGIKETYHEGDEVKFTIIPDEDYNLPETIHVTGVDNYEYNIDAETGIATFTCVMGTEDIDVSVFAVLTHTVAFNGTDCTANGIKEIYDEGDDVEFTITPDERYILPETIQVTGVDNYEYNIGAETGIATFTCVMGKNNISVTVVAIGIPHKMNFEGENCTANNEQSYAENQDVEFTITPNEGYTLPSRIDVDGVDNYEYSIDAQTGNATFTCVMGTEDIDVSVFAGLTRTVTFNGTGCTSDARSSYAEGDKVEIIITPDEGYILPNEIEVEGIKGRYDYNLKEDGTALLVFTVGADNITITVKATQG